jgi:uncharacterized protein (DUF1778 family)
MSDPFANIIGHTHLCELLRRVLFHPGNAYLFFGPTQVGKRLIAERFTAALLNHPVERALESHPDFIRVTREDEAKEIVVKQARELIQRVSLSASRGGRTVVLIEEADRLNEEAANALLKVIEEPAAHITYLLLAERAERLPATLRSRLAILPFQRVSTSTITDWLITSGANPEQAREAAEWSHGRPGLAKRILEGRKDFELERTRATKFVETLQTASLGARLAAIEEITQSIERSDEPERRWREFLQLCMQAAGERFAMTPVESARVSAGLIHAWKMVGSSLSPRFALEWSGVQSTLSHRSLPSFLQPLSL